MNLFGKIKSIVSSNSIRRWIKSKSIKSCSLHNPLPLERHAYVLQYAPVYAVWLWVYLNKYSDWLSDSPELATFSLLVVVALNALLLLSTAWSVSAKAWLTTSTVKKMEIDLIDLHFSHGISGWMDGDERD